MAKLQSRCRDTDGYKSYHFFMVLGLLIKVLVMKLALVSAFIDMSINYVSFIFIFHKYI